MTGKRRVAYLVVLYLCLFLGVEVVFHLATLVSSRWALVLSRGIPPSIEDPVLGYRPNPAAPDHDESGWRNAERLERAPVVALGDSQTYGATVARANAWPQRLAERAGIPVYNMALSGYDPTQYLLVLDEALELTPQVVLVGFFAGNDVGGSYLAVYENGRLPALKSQDPEVLAAIEEAQAAGPVYEAWERTSAAERSAWREWTDPILDTFRKYSAVWGLLRAVKRVLVSGPEGMTADMVREDWESYRAFAEGKDPALFFPIDGRARTVLTPASRLGTLDQDDPRVAEGAAITLKLFDRMRDRCGQRCEVVAVFIPTKELSFANLAEAAAGPPELKELSRWEELWWDQLRAHLRDRGMRWIDTLPSLREAIARGENPYYMDWNGHLGVVGNDLVAKAIAESEPLRSLARDGGSR